MNNDFLTQQSVLCRASRPPSFTETIKDDPAYHSSCAIFIIQVFWGPRCNDSVRRCSPSSPSYYDDLVLVPGAPFRPRCALKRQLVIMVLSQTPLTQRCTTISSKPVFGSKLASITLTLNQLHCVSSVFYWLQVLFNCPPDQISTLSRLESLGLHKEPELRASDVVPSSSQDFLSPPVVPIF